MRRNYRFIGTAAVILGLALAAFPLTRWGMASYYQHRALSAWQEAAQEPTQEEPEYQESPLQSELPQALPSEDGLLEIPKISLRAVVIHGVSEDDLKLGPGFYPQSSYPLAGNVSIAAHRGVYGAWFRNLDRLAAGDEIVLTIGGVSYRYLVRERFITHSRDWGVIESTGKPELTLTTCLFTTDTKRMIVKADLVETWDAAEPVSIESE